jgi:hypothetical protein
MIQLPAQQTIGSEAQPLGSSVPRAACAQPPMAACT